MYRQQSLINLDNFDQLKPATKPEAILNFIDFIPFKMYSKPFLNQCLKFILKSNFIIPKLKENFLSLSVT